MDPEQESNGWEFDSVMWWLVAVFVASLVLSLVLQPKPQNMKPSGLSDIKAPTAEDGREIAVLFGNRDIAGPNVVWYGDLKTVAIKSKGGKK